jgi:SMI1 / KNR4 family (SUKH-1)
MASDPFATLLARMAKTGVATADLEGCTKVEIDTLESRYGVRLPDTYRCFLQVMGRRSGRLFRHDWVDTDYSFILAETAEVRARLTEEDIAFELPADALVILGRDGDQLNFIRCNNPDDSPVWAVFLDEEPVRARQCFRLVVGWMRAWAKEAAEAVADGYYEHKTNRG